MLSLCIATIRDQFWSAAYMLPLPFHLQVFTKSSGLSDFSKTMVQANSLR